MPELNLLKLAGLAATVVHVLGFLAAIQAMMRGRSAQGAIAWSISLITFPYLALPLFWVFGRKKFQGYVDARRAGDLDINHIAQNLRESAAKFIAQLDEDEKIHLVLEKLAVMRFTRSNQAELLINGQETFGRIFQALSSARDYVLIQFYIIRNDVLGQALKRALIRKARQGVRVYVLYDEIGSSDLDGAYIRELREKGVRTSRFKTTRGSGNRFQINFRNHRKIVIVDGRIAFIGGHNVGDEYLGRDRKLSPWRDTHVMLQGPSATCAQLSFLADWHWATDETPELDWRPAPAPEGDMKVLTLPSGPADYLETCALFFFHAIKSAKKRVWIASPYFVPDDQSVSALQLAGLSGLDVRIIIPSRTDNRLVNLAAHSYLPELEPAGVKVFRYTRGFMHQKTMLIDDSLAVVGTANMDNRSFRLNFEISMIFLDKNFAKKVEIMLEKDFNDSNLITAARMAHRPYSFRLAARAARLMSPIL